MPSEQPQKFEDTKLLQHREVKKAYDYYIEAKNEGDIAAEIVEEGGLGVAATISSLSVNKDPNLVAASIMMPFIMNLNEGDEEKAEKIRVSFDPLTLEYAEAFSIMMHPFGISEVFPTLPKTHRTAAVTIAVATGLAGLEQLEKEAPQMSKGELKSVLANEGDGTMPTLDELVSYVRLRKAEPQLMDAFDTLKQSLTDLANGTQPKPAASKNAPKP